MPDADDKLPSHTGDIVDAPWLEHCLRLAAAAAAAGEVPVGAVVVRDGELLGEGRNRVEEQKNPLRHAEMLALEQAFAVTGDKRLPGSVLYCSLEPCFQCAGAIVHSRVKRVVFAAR